MNKVFKIFANCIPVKGEKQSVICDLQRESYKHIPNSLFEILTEHTNETIANIKSHYDNKYDETIDSYFKFLIDNDFGFFTDTPELFPDLNLEWDSPSEITNAIIDFDSDSKHDISKIIDELNKLNCFYIQLRFYDEFSHEEIDAILNTTLKSKVKSVELILKYSDDNTNTDLKHLLDNNLRVNIVFVHTSPENKILSDISTKNWAKTVFVTDNITSEDFCGIVRPEYFSVNLQTFTEAQKYNTCLNRKVAIDKKGEIKNCPAMHKSFGNIKNNSIKEIIKLPEFQELWHISKDKITTCRDCEYRYICTDCRAFVENINDKPTKCTYNPMIKQWTKM